MPVVFPHGLRSVGELQTDSIRAPIRRCRLGTRGSGPGLCLLDQLELVHIEEPSGRPGQQHLVIQTFCSHSHPDVGSGNSRSRQADSSVRPLLPVVGRRALEGEAGSRIPRWTTAASASGDARRRRLRRDSFFSGDDPHRRTCCTTRSLFAGRPVDLRDTHRSGGPCGHRRIRSLMVGQRRRRPEPVEQPVRPSSRPACARSARAQRAHG